MINITDRILDAFQYVKAAHEGQLRKYTGEPYWTHLIEVAEIVSAVTSDEDLIVAAVAHDLYEDITPLQPEAYSLNNIRKVLGERSSRIMVELTNSYTKKEFPHLNRAERKSLERNRLGKISNDAKTIKLADNLSNGGSHFPEEEKGFQTIYMAEIRELHPFLKGGNEILWNKVKNMLDAFYAKQ